MNVMKTDPLTAAYAESFRTHWHLPALTDYTEQETFSYGDVACEIAKLHLFFEQCQIHAGDKIALVGKNTPRWAITFIATITYGAVIVPILQDFNPNDIHHIVNHSDSVLLFTNDMLWEHLEEDRMRGLRGVVSLSHFECLAQRDGEMITHHLHQLPCTFATRYPQEFRPEDIHYPTRNLAELMVLNYTSGTTGFSKGVMLSGTNLWSNIEYGLASGLHWKESRCLAILPLAHAYGCLYDLVAPLILGTHITLLGRVPSPKILLTAFEKIKPHLIVSVPLILEKIYRKQLQPMLNKRSLRFALNIPLLDHRIYSQVCRKLVAALGGEFQQIIIGGAPINPEVEAFLHKIKFPFTVGYGMTECAPLVSYTPYHSFIPTSAGKILEHLEAKVLSPNAEEIAGEICIRGSHVMMGYYKNEEASKAVLDEDGWLHTGDIGTLSADNTLYLKGRCKTMILRANGQNIYPEEIETKLNNQPFILESLVFEKNGRLVAYVYPDYEEIDTNGIPPGELPIAMEEVRRNLNTQLAVYETIAKIELYPTEFEKTPKRSIKRYLYSSIAEN